jgi:hypothetical protein
MSYYFSRQELYELIWSDTITSLSAKLDVSTAGIKKTCQEMHIPTPPQGYWLKKNAGKRVYQIPLPNRPPGLADDTMFGGGRYWRHYNRWTEEELLGPIPPAPVFKDTMDEIRQAVIEQVRNFTASKDLQRPHPAVAKLIVQDEAKREMRKTRGWISSFDEPLYESAAQQRRLRIVSAILIAAASHGCRADIAGSTAMGAIMNDFSIKVGHQTVNLRAEVIEQSNPNGMRTGDTVRHVGKIRISLDKDTTNHSWEDGNERLEQQARSILIALIVNGEEQHRSEVFRRHQWRIQLREDLIERRRKAREEADRKERERLVELDKQRVGRLLDEADAFQKAGMIRRYVDQVVAANRMSRNPLPEAEMASWSTWALEQADKIDPVASGAFLLPAKDDSGS